MAGCARKHLPGYPTIALLDTYGDPAVTESLAAMILAVWVVAAVAAGTWSLLARGAA